jgi:hypothetical protein
MHTGAISCMDGKWQHRWDPYDLKSRATMVFNLNSYIQNDPYPEIRRILLDSGK